MASPFAKFGNVVSFSPRLLVTDSRIACHLKIGCIGESPPFTLRADERVALLFLFAELEFSPLKPE
jgi:hypothetical protein